MAWEPPGKNCGACGAAACSDFLAMARQGKKDLRDCPYYPARPRAGTVPAPVSPSGRDILGFDYDFVIRPMPNEPSARRYVLPFRPDLAERWGIKPGDILRGRPVDPSCPIQHVLRVISADTVTGIIACHTVGPVAARRSPLVYDIRAYHEVGFEGLAETVRHEPVVGYRQRFLPVNCMRQMVHSGVVQMVLNKSWGTHVRVEDLQMHGKREKLKDVTIRPGDAISVMDASGARKTVLIDGIRVHTSEGTVIERSKDEGDDRQRQLGQGKGDGHGQGHGKGDGSGRGRGGRHRHDRNGDRNDDDD